MAELKTKPNDASVEKYLDNIDDSKKREDCVKILDIMKDVTGEKPKMWGDSIVGLGTYHYKYASGREGDWMLTGFSARKQNISVYVLSGFKHLEKYLKKLGTYKTGKSCLYINTLEDVDTSVLKDIISHSIKVLKIMYPD